MLKTDEAFTSALTSLVGEVEKQTGAELVVVASPQSGGYRDISLGVGAFSAWLLLAFACWSPWDFDALLFPVDTVLVGGLIGLGVARNPRLLRLFVSEARAVRQVRESAEAAFLQESVMGTENRTGVLIYVSLMEEKALVIPDPVLSGRLPAGALGQVQIQAGSLEQLSGGLRALGGVLARHVPRQDNDTNELTDAPRVRS